MISTIQLALVSKSVFLYIWNAIDVCFFVSGHPETARTHAVCVSLSFFNNVNQRGTEVPDPSGAKLHKRQKLSPVSLLGSQRVSPFASWFHTEASSPKRRCPSVMRCIDKPWSKCQAESWDIFIFFITDWNETFYLIRWRIDMTGG